MTGIRRIVVLIGLTLAVIVAAVVPASASFAESVTVRPNDITTITVAAPASMTINDYCGQTTTSYWNGYTTVYNTSYWYDATVTWPASTTAKGVTGYKVMAHLNDGTSVAIGQTDALNRRVNTRVDRAYLGYQPRVSIVTLTSYGWTAETARSAVLAC
jgi:hypothetical protein